MIDIVYVLGKGSQWDNNEIRYSLRSVQKHVKGYRNVFIVGECPAFLNETIIHIPADETGNIASKNILKKILIACNDQRVSNEFLFMNDDFFFTKDIYAPSYPYYYNNTLENAARKAIGNWYREYLVASYNILNLTNKETKNFDIHTPIIYDKTIFKKLFEIIHEEKKVLKSIYCNVLEIKGLELPDTKLRGHVTNAEVEEIINSGHLFSIGDWCLSSGYVQKRLNKMFPDKSKYES